MTALRIVAADLLMAWLREKGSLSALHEGREDFLALEVRDRRLVTEIVHGCVRLQGRLTFFIRTLSKARGEPRPDIDAVLMVALYQLLELDRVPDHAVINDAVNDARRRRGNAASRYVNGLLREVQRRRDEQRLPAPDGPPESALAIWYNLPKWVVQRWLERFGETEARAFMEWTLQRPVPCGWMVDGSPMPESESVPHVPGAFLLPGGKAEHLTDPNLHFQSASSQLVALLVDPQPEERILDMCAAPGGKSARIAHRSPVKVIAVEESAERCATLRATLQRLSVRNAEVILGNALKLTNHRVGPIDRVLVDAPCSTLGALQRTPEARRSRRKSDLATYRDRQVALVTRALELVKPGGRVVYSVCSLEPEENEQVLATVLEGRSDVYLEGIPSRFADLFTSVPFANGNAYRLLPWKAGPGHEGFFVGMLRKGIDKVIGDKAVR